MIPTGALTNSRTRVLLAVLNGDRTTDELIRTTRLSRQRVNHHVHRLRDEGLVDFADGKQCTLHATCVIVEPRGTLNRKARS